MPRLGDTVGHIRVTELLARGGMGDVYAGYDEKLGRRVALKTIRSEFRLDAEAKARFLREARILSQLEHPRICRIHDLVEEADEDVLVLELIQGKSLREAIRGGLDSEGKMAITRQIVDVLAVAHAGAVVHRDLKPDNIMVEPDGGVKVLDFGLARSVDELASAPTLEMGKHVADVTSDEPERPPETGAVDVRTRMGSVMGTLGYMSPEQARGEPATTASDMYSCGLLLQEIFTGRPPFEPGIDRATLLARTTRGETVPVTGIDADLAALIVLLKSVAPAERLSARETAQRLEWIVAKPARRRRRVLVAAAMVGLTLLSAFTTVQTFRAQREARRANEQAEAARQVSDFLTSLFKVSDPREARGNTVTAREILDRGAAKIAQDLKDQPLVQARLMDTMGRVYESLGLYDAALPQLEAALGIRRRLLGEEHLDVATTLVDLGSLWWHKGDYARARPLFEQGLAIRERVLGPDDLQVAGSLHNLGNLLWSHGEYDAAERLLERARTIRETRLGPSHPDVASTLNSLGAIAYKKGDLAQARRLWEQTLAIREQALGPDHPFLAQTLNNLAVVQTDLGDPTGARPLLERVVRIQEKVLGPDHPDLASGLSNLGEAISASGDQDGARAHLQRAVEIEEAASPENPELARFLDRLARVTLKHGDVEGARRLYERSLALREKALGPGNHELAESLIGLAECARREGHDPEAARHYERALGLSRRPDGGYYPLAVAILDDYVAVLRATGRQPRAAEVEALAASLRGDGS